MPVSATLHQYFRFPICIGNNSNIIVKIARAPSCLGTETWIRMSCFRSCLYTLEWCQIQLVDSSFFTLTVGKISLCVGVCVSTVGVPSVHSFQYLPLTGGRQALGSCICWRRSEEACRLSSLFASSLRPVAASGPYMGSRIAVRPHFYQGSTGCPDSWLGQYWSAVAEDEKAVTWQWRCQQQQQLPIHVEAFSSDHEATASVEWCLCIACRLVRLS